MKEDNYFKNFESLSMEESLDVNGGGSFIGDTVRFVGKQIKDAAISAVKVVERVVGIGSAAKAGFESGKNDDCFNFIK
ncbi:hypothetical protein EW093_02260 [Thiospirochaeta perfilievii]|uniref:Bacteriocin n=1 Tax=Thiospirochaeta perfilievii TaxID=252967 RepID=A0A5C1Q897_9SPIO|nr:hypothetical protein [Thiospirochaeta perfilievii]QEN03568.1 hypothetical protein EW093_02260 [Thiospirochaeta perfilievii]